VKSVVRVWIRVASSLTLALVPVPTAAQRQPPDTVRVIATLDRLMADASRPHHRRIRIALPRAVLTGGERRLLIVPL
jgi:hypothetical protein